jgi:hypothetical protein
MYAVNTCSNASCYAGSYAGVREALQGSALYQMDTFLANSPTLSLLQNSSFKVGLLTVSLSLSLSLND